MIQKNNAVLYIILLGWFSLAILILLSPKGFISDEYVYHQNLYSGYPPFSVEFIREYKGTAGIVSTWFHLLILKITNGDIVKMRTTNLFWLFLTALVFNKVYKNEENADNKPLGFALILSPYVFQMTSRVMGEFPVFFMGFTFYILFNKIDNSNYKWYWYIATGFIGAIAIAGKQTFIFLLVFPVYSLLSSKSNFWKKTILLLSLCSLPACLFTIWGGLSPKSSSFRSIHNRIAHEDFLFVLICIALTGVVFYAYYIKEFIIAHVKKIFIFLVLVHVILGFIFFFSESIATTHTRLVHYIKIIAKVSFGFTGALFLYTCCKEAFKKATPLVIFVSLSCLAFLKIPYFEGRYLALIAPFILLLLLKADKIRLTPLTAFIGYTFNLVSILVVYYPQRFIPIIKWVKGVLREVV